MKKLFAKFRFIGTFLVVAAMCLPAMNVRAEGKTYTVTFRPGNVGYFALTKDAAGSRQEMAGAVAAQVYGSNYEVTKNGAIKVTVPAGAAAPDAPVYIQTEDGYFVKDTELWGPAENQNVDKNMDFVVDYGKLVNGVEYTVKYVDSSSGESIAPVYIAQANVGETRTVTAPRQIVISAGTVYNLSSAASLELVLDADSDKNIFTFSYTLAPGETVVEEVIDYVDGGTVTTTEMVTTYVDNGTTVTTTPAGQTGGQNQAQNGGAADENGAENVTIEDEDTPLAPADTDAQPDKNGNDVVTIGEDEVPLAEFDGGNASYAAVIWAGVFVAAAAAITAFWLFTKKKRQLSDSDSTEE